MAFACGQLRRKTMSANQEKPVVRIAPNNPVFALPVIVAIEEGLFAEAGLDVSFSATYADREKDSAASPIMTRLKENLFDCGSADSYNACELASIPPPRGRQARGDHPPLAPGGRPARAIKSRRSA